jgi:hypothetical protein
MSDPARDPREVRRAVSGGRADAPEGRADAPEVDILMELILHWYASRLTAEQLDSVRETVERIVSDVQALRLVRLSSSDEPVPVFVPFRADP